MAGHGRGPHPVPNEPVDPDVDLRVPAQRDELRRRHAPVVAAVSLGGGIGAAARYGASLLWPTQAGTFPWTTLLVNVTGCALIGLFMVVLTELRSAHRLLRPFFGTGVLGGFTTFSTYATDIQRLIEEGSPRTALACLGLTVAGAVAAVWAAASLTRRALAWRQR
ncbi:CrcB family protein [Streptomyces tubbatahanensis]|uniref:Fluoride-specific ion channel FluC n=1 Tax=Streptomyces tubbatahanensis TaxID=2923272 RepID=A0ABY3XMW0_9ACTN|nr:CrcB family protein [Streptomyces tubbatahanensis]UNS95757.1 CrcB family protein [Streptomyces tubbatahanensis]